MIEFGVVYWENGNASFRECASEVEAREAFENAPLSGEFVELFVDWEVAESRETD